MLTFYRRAKGVCFVTLAMISQGVVALDTARAQSTNQLTGVIRQAAPKLMGQQTSGNDLLPGTREWEASEKARENLLEAADKESGGSTPPGGNPLFQMPKLPLGQNGNTIKIPTK